MRVFCIELGNTVRSFLACQKVLDRERPDRVVLYSSGYSVNLVWCLLAEKRGIPFYYMNAGANLSDRLQKLVIARPFATAASPPILGPLSAHTLCPAHVGLFDGSFSRVVARSARIGLFGAQKR